MDRNYERRRHRHSPINDRHKFREPRIKQEPVDDDDHRSSRRHKTHRIKEEPRDSSYDENRSRPRSHSRHGEDRAKSRSPRRRPRKEEKEMRRKREDEEAANFQYGQNVKEEPVEDETPIEKQKPNFGLSGKLTEEKNTFNGVVVKYSEPPEARIPKRRWRFYVFKGEESMPTLYLHRQSAYLIGRDRKVADIPSDHPSCSKQHAVLQFRLVNYERPDGSSGRTVRPYIIDLEAANGTFVNGQKIDSKRYVELFERDVVKFGFSSREYVLLHEESKADAAIDDVGQATSDDVPPV